jgi:hypothetical protein
MTSEMVLQMDQAALTNQEIWCNFRAIPAPSPLKNVETLLPLINHWTILLFLWGIYIDETYQNQEAKISPRWFKPIPVARSLWTASLELRGQEISDLPLDCMSTNDNHLSLFLCPLLNMWSNRWLEFWPTRAPSMGVRSTCNMAWFTLWKVTRLGVTSPQGLTAIKGERLSDF